MNDLPPALGATGLSAAVMYLRCLRPMRRHRGQRTLAVDPAREQLAELRREVASLREQGKVR